MLVTLVVIALFPLVAGYIVLVERKVLADFQVRLGPMRVGPHGLLQPIADALKLLLKEDIIPTDADQSIFWLAPVISTFTGLTAFAVIPFSKYLYVADVNVGLLVISAMSAVGILGIILGGWASNSHYPLLGALRSAAQLVSYEVALSFALAFGRHGGGHAEHAGHYPGAADPRHLVCLLQLRLHDRALRGVHHRRDRGNQPRAVRPARSRIGISGRVPHGIQRLPLGALLPGGVRQHLRDFVGGRDALLGRMAAAVSQRFLAGGANYIVPLVVFAGSGLASLTLVRKLKDTLQQKVLVGAALLLV